jgi:hypothetical protein
VPGQAESHGRAAAPGGFGFQHSLKTAVPASAAVSGLISAAGFVLLLLILTLLLNVLGLAAGEAASGTDIVSILLHILRGLLGLDSGA